MRTVVSVLIGFVLGRQVYINLSQQEAKAKEQRIKERIQELLEAHGVSSKVAEEEGKSIAQITQIS